MFASKRSSRRPSSTSHLLSTPNQPASFSFSRTSMTSSGRLFVRLWEQLFQPTSSSQRAKSWMASRTLTELYVASRLSPSVWLLANCHNRSSSLPIVQQSRDKKNLTHNTPTSLVTGLSRPTPCTSSLSGLLSRLKDSVPTCSIIIRSWTRRSLPSGDCLRIGSWMRNWSLEPASLESQVCQRSSRRLRARDS